jgi:hypothetical protein
MGVVATEGAGAAIEVTRKCGKNWQDLQPLWRDIGARLA